MPTLRFSPSGPPVPDEPPVSPTWNETLEDGNVASISPHIDAPFFLSFGNVAALPASGSVRASAALQMASTVGVALTAGSPTVVPAGAGEIRCLGTGDCTFQTTAAGMAISAQTVPTPNPGNLLLEASDSIAINTSVSLQMTAQTAMNLSPTSSMTLTGGAIALTKNGVSSALTIRTNNVIRLSFETDGSWNVGGSNGTLGQLLQNRATIATTWTSPSSIALSITVPAVAAGEVGYVDTTLVGTALENIVGQNGGVVVNPRSDLVAAGPGGGFLNARMSAANTLRTAFLGPLAGGASTFSVTKVR